MFQSFLLISMFFISSLTFAIEEEPISIVLGAELPAFCQAGQPGTIRCPGKNIILKNDTSFKAQERLVVEAENIEVADAFTLESLSLLATKDISFSKGSQLYVQGDLRVEGHRILIDGSLFTNKLTIKSKVILQRSISNIESKVIDVLADDFRIGGQIQSQIARVNIGTERAYRYLELSGKFIVELLTVIGPDYFEIKEQGILWINNGFIHSKTFANRGFFRFRVLAQEILSYGKFSGHLKGRNLLLTNYADMVVDPSARLHLNRAKIHGVNCIDGGQWILDEKLGYHCKSLTAIEGGEWRAPKVMLTGDRFYLGNAIMADSLEVKAQDLYIAESGKLAVKDARIRGESILVNGEWTGDRAYFEGSYVFFGPHSNIDLTKLEIVLTQGLGEQVARSMHREARTEFSKVERVFENIQEQRDRADVALQLSGMDGDFALEQRVKLHAFRAQVKKAFKEVSSTYGLAQKIAKIEAQHEQVGQTAMSKKSHEDLAYAAKLGEFRTTLSVGFFGVINSQNLKIDAHGSLYIDRDAELTAYQLHGRVQDGTFVSGKIRGQIIDFFSPQFELLESGKITAEEKLKIQSDISLLLVGLLESKGLLQVKAGTLALAPGAMLKGSQVNLELDRIKNEGIIQAQEQLYTKIAHHLKIEDLGQMDSESWAVMDGHFDADEVIELLQGNRGQLVAQGIKVVTSEPVVIHRNVSSAGDLALESREKIIFAEDVRFAARNVNFHADDHVVLEAGAEVQALEHLTVVGLQGVQQKARRDGEATKSSSMDAGGSLMIETDGKYVSEGSALRAKETLVIRAKEGLYVIPLLWIKTTTKTSENLFTKTESLTQQQQQKKAQLEGRSILMDVERDSLLVNTQITGQLILNRDGGQVGFKTIEMEQEKHKITTFTNTGKVMFAAVRGVAAAYGNAFPGGQILASVALDLIQAQALGRKLNMKHSLHQAALSYASAQGTEMMFEGALPRSIHKLDRLLIAGSKSLTEASLRCVADECQMDSALFADAFVNGVFGELAASGKISGDHFRNSLRDAASRIALDALHQAHKVGVDKVQLGQALEEGVQAGVESYVHGRVADRCAGDIKRLTDFFNGLADVSEVLEEAQTEKEKAEAFRALKDLEGVREGLEAEEVAPLDAYHSEELSTEAAVGLLVEELDFSENHSSFSEENLIYVAEDGLSVYKSLDEIQISELVTWESGQPVFESLGREIFEETLHFLKEKGLQVASAVLDPASVAHGFIDRYLSEGLERDGAHLLVDAADYAHDAASIASVGAVGLVLAKKAMRKAAKDLAKAAGKDRGKGLAKQGKWVGNSNSKTKDVIQVTPDGVALPPGRTIPKHYVENPHRPGSYGEILNGKFKEKLRIDPATPAGQKGPNYSHYHKNGKGKHYSPRPGDKDPGFE